MTEICPAELVVLAERLADASGAVIRRYFRSSLVVQDKADQTPVTVADREAEGVIRMILEQQRSDDGILGEEHGAKNLDSEYLWVIDPIDGTKAFITGRPTFGTLIALLRHGTPILGVIDQPVIADRWVGAKGRPATQNGRPARTRRCAALGNAIVSTTSPQQFPGDDRAPFERLEAASKILIYGGDCYAYGLLASGWQDGVVEGTMKLYDFAALAPVIESAGGVITDWDGRPLDRHSGDKIWAAGDAAVHAEGLGVLKR